MMSPWRWFRLAMVLLVFGGASVTRADPDLWGHVRFGLDTLHAGHLTSIDPYSFTQDVPWVNHEWLSEVQMGAAYALGGDAGLAVVKAALTGGVLLLVWAALGGVRTWVRVLVAALAIMGTLHMWATIRPQLWSLLGMTLLSRLLPRERSSHHWWLPLIFAVWVNCHGGWIVGLGVLGVWAFGSVLRRPADTLHWALIVVSCALATLLNPYGWGLWAFMAKTVRMSRSIAEWGPLWGTPFLNWIPWIVLTAAALWSLWPLSSANRTGRLRAMLVLTMLAFASARVMRIESLFVVVGAVLLGPWLRERWPTRPEAPRRLPDSAQPAAALAFTVMATGAAVALAIHGLSCVREFGAWVPDATTAQALDDAQAGRLVTFFDWGEYALWHFGPRLRVSMDGRRETVYSEARLEEHDAILAGKPAGLASLAAWRAEYVWLPSTAATTRQWLASHGYRIDVDGSRSFVAVRADLPVLRAKGPGTRADCFPE